MSIKSNKSRDKPIVIHVVVVEYHQHALEHIHSRLRRHKSLKPWSMLHFDAHPDLACPSNHVPALACFIPRQGDIDHDLYELLDSHSSGIAEWIIPLVLAGELRRVHWMKPTESQQLPLGRHEYHVGAWIPPTSELAAKEVESFLDLPMSARVRVDWKIPYYLDDASVAPTEELCLAKKLDLTVSELPYESESSSDQATFEGDWALDICLDYFCCRNPFLTDIEEIDEKFARALVNAVVKPRLYNATNGDIILEPVNYENELSRFRSVFEQLLQGKDASSINEMLQFYESEDEARVLIEDLVESLSRSSDSAKLSTMAMEALPNLCMPHDPKNSIEDIQRSIQLHLESMSSAIRHVKNDSGDPFIVTIARSTLDGFTPASVVENLQEQVLSSVHDIFCGCDIIYSHGDGSIRPEGFEWQAPEECRLKVHFDYGEWEGTTLE